MTLIHSMARSSARFAVRSVALLPTAMAVAAPALAQERRLPASQAELRLSYAPIVQRVQPAVVNVDAAKMVQEHNLLLDDPIFRRFFGARPAAGADAAFAGSGVMVDPSGLVVTNVHVIEAPTRSRCRCPTNGN